MHNLSQEDEPFSYQRPLTWNRIEANQKLLERLTPLKRRSGRNQVYHSSIQSHEDWQSNLETELPETRNRLPYTSLSQRSRVPSTPGSRCSGTPPPIPSIGEVIHYKSSQTSPAHHLISWLIKFQIVPGQLNPMENCSGYLQWYPQQERSLSKSC